MTTDSRVNASIWENIYSKGHALSYPNDVFVIITHRLLSPDKRPKVMDHGFGSGENLLHLARRGFHVSGCEVSESALKTASARFAEAGLKADLRLIEGGRLPFPDCSFDAVVSWQVLNYNDWKSLRAAVDEIERVLKPGGLVLCATNAPGDFQHKNSEPIGNDEYRMKATARDQEGAVTVIVEKDRLQEFFPGRKLSIGHFGNSWDGVDVRYWVVSYEKK